jgi:hypothetical protein
MQTPEREAWMELAQARKARITPRMGGRILADALVAQGIDHVFEVPGESFLDTLDGLYDVRQKLKLVTCRFEAGAVNMAEAYGKLTGRPAAAFVTRGPARATARSASTSPCRTRLRCCCSSARSRTRIPAATHSRRLTIAGCFPPLPNG